MPPILPPRPGNEGDAVAGFDVAGSSGRPSSSTGGRVIVRAAG